MTEQARWKSIGFVVLILLAFLLLCLIPARAESQGMTCQVQDVKPETKDVVLVCPPSAIYSPLIVTLYLHGESIPLSFQGRIVRLLNNGPIVVDKKKYDFEINRITFHQDIYGK